MKNESNSKTWLMIGGVIAGAAILYFVYVAFSAPAIAPEATLAQTSEDQIAAQRVLAILNEIQQLRIDTRLFQSAAFQSLIDYTVPIPDQGVGRTNPFAPIPGLIVPGEKSR